MSNANQDSDDDGGNGFNFGPDILEALLRASTNATDADDLNSLGAISGEYSSINKTIDELNGFLDRWEERHSSLSSQIDEVLEEQKKARLQREKEKNSASSSSSAGQQEEETEEQSDADGVLSRGPNSSSVPLRGVVESSEIESASQSQTTESPKTNSIDTRESASAATTTTDVCNDSNSNSDDLVSTVEGESPCEKLS